LNIRFIKGKHTGLILKIIFGVLMMFIIIKDVNFSNIIEAIKNPRHKILIYISVFLLIPNMYVQWFRWHFLIKLIRKDVKVKDTLGSYLSGMAAGFVTPGRVGEISRYLFLPEVDHMKAAAMVVIDKAYAAVPIIAVGVWGLSLMLMYVFSYNLFLLIPLLVTAVIISSGILVIFVHPSWIRTLLYNISLLFPYRDKVKRFMSCFDLFSRANAVYLLSLSFILYFVYILQFILLAHAFQSMAVTTSLYATVTTMFVKTLLPVSFADLGIREGAAVYFFTQLHVSKVTAFNSSILLFAINVLVPSVIGLFVIIFSGRGKNNSNTDVESEGDTI